MTCRLQTLSDLPDGIGKPRYVPAEHGVGIVHLGLGAFHKAHQAYYTDAALSLSGGNWRIAGVSLRSQTAARELNPQNGLYTLIERSPAGSGGRVIGSVARALSLTQDRRNVLDALTAVDTRIVSLTVTEKAYGVNRATGGVDTSHKAIAADLKAPHQPQGVAGLLVWAIGQRRAASVPPFTVLCCDNLPDNGRMLRGLVLDFARRAAPDLVGHIQREVAFPSTMVDRITPKRTDTTLSDAERFIGIADLAAEETESYSQWVVEDDFPSGRPDWDRCGVIMTGNVAPYELMKLRMLNGTHSMLAYAGFLAGHKYVRDVMADGALAALVRRHLASVAGTLQPVAGVDFERYAADLVKRFENPHLAHETYQIAMDGTEKLPQRLLAPAVDTLAKGGPADPLAFAVAAWMRYVLGVTDAGQKYALRDPLEQQLANCVGGLTKATEIASALTDFLGLFPQQLRRSDSWRGAVASRLDVMLRQNMRKAIDLEAGLGG